VSPQHLCDIIDPKNHKLVCVQDVVSRVLGAVDMNLPLAFPDRVPPVMISAPARSGKTTLLFSVFDALTKRGDCAPIVVSFNGQFGFNLRKTDSMVHNFCRGIHEQLFGVQDCESPKLLDLQNYMSKSVYPIVLLIDELNALAPEGDADLARVLRSEFLDHQDRHLVFTCHYPMCVGDALGVVDQDSPRQAIMIDVPLSLKPNDYAPVFSESKLMSPIRLAIYGGLCGLVVTTGLNSPPFDIDRYFGDATIRFSSEERPKAVLKLFFDQILSGESHIRLAKYQRFTHFPEGAHGRPVWPLCFIAAYLKLAGHKEISTLLEMVVSVCEGGFEHSDGMEWQALVVASVAINITAGQFTELGDTVAGITGSITKGSFFRMIHLPPHIMNASDAEEYILSIISSPKVGVILAYATHPAFQSFDCIILHWDGTSISGRIGLQAKQGSSVVKENAPDGWLGFLFRGNAPSSAGRVKKVGWTYLTSEEVADFIPFSLQQLLPARWP
jgi:hypothetical protein